MRICHFSKFVRSESIIFRRSAPDCIRATRRSIRSTKKPAALYKLSFTRGYDPNSYTGSIYLCETVSTNAMRFIEIVSCESYSHILFHLSTLSLPFRSTTTASFPFKNYPLSSKCNNNNNNKKKKKSDKRIKDTREKPGLGMERNDIILLTNIRDK